MADIYGQLVKAQFEHSTSDLSNVSGLAYYKSDTGVLKYYDAVGTAWRTLATTDTAIADVTTTRGDLIRRGASGLERFAAVTNNRVVRGNGTDVVLGQIDDTGFFTTGAAASASNIGIVTTSAQTFTGQKTFSNGGTAHTDGTTLIVVDDVTNNALMNISIDSASYVSSAFQVRSRRASSSAFDFILCQSGDDTNYTGGSSRFIVRGDGRVFAAGNLIVGGNTTGDSNLGTISSVEFGSYYEGTFTANFNGGMNTNTNNYTVTYRKIGKLVILQMQGGAALVTANATNGSWFTASGTIPSALRPAANLEVPTVLYDAGTRVSGYVSITTAGVIEFFRIGSQWDNGDANSGFSNVSFSYPC